MNLLSNSKLLSRIPAKTAMLMVKTKPRPVFREGFCPRRKLLTRIITRNESGQLNPKATAKDAAMPMAKRSDFLLTGSDLNIVNDMDLPDIGKFAVYPDSESCHCI